MSWSALAANQWVSRNDLQDAVNTSVFTLKSGQTIPAGNNWVTRTEVETWINATVTQGASNQWPQKSWIIASATWDLQCPVITSNQVGTQINFSFTLPSSTADNPSLKKILIKAFNNTTGTIDGTYTFTQGTPPNPTSYSNSITGLSSGSTYKVNLDFLGAGDVVLQSCGLPPVIKQITQLGSPQGLLIFNTNDNLMYGIDTDTCAAKSGSTDGSIYRFDPTTAQTIADFTYVNLGGLPNTGVYYAPTNKIYVQGPKTGGIYAYSCNTQTFGTLMAYGPAPGTFTYSRGNMYLLGGMVYAGYTAISGFKVINPTTDTFAADFVPSWPDNTDQADITMIEVGSTEIWVLITQTSNIRPRIYFYNKSNVSAGPTGEIDDVVLNKDANNKYTASWMLKDATGNKVWFAAPKDNKIYAYSASTKALLHTISVPTEGYTYARLVPYLHPNGTLYFTGRLNNDLTGVGVARTYEINTSSGTIANVYSLGIGNFIYAPTTGNTYGTVSGIRSYDGGTTTGYDSDGKVQVFN